MRTDGKNPMYIFALAVAGLFLAGFFLLLVFGGNGFRTAAAMQQDHMGSRALSAYIVTGIRGSDSAGAVTLREGAEGPVLVIAEGNTGFAKRIYRWEGNLVEDYARTDADLMPDQAVVIAPTEVFEVQRPAPDRLVVTTDEGRTLITLRSEGGGGQ